MHGGPNWMHHFVCGVGYTGRLDLDTCTTTDKLEVRYGRKEYAKRQL